jgi:DNA-binding transcriptional LysR family regulator
MLVSYRKVVAVDIKHLEAVVTVAEAGSVTRAAELLHIVQPAVTRHIRALEDELGVVLFARTRHGMRPTEAGKVMVERARRALIELERARAELRPEQGQLTGIVSVGLLESVVDLLAVKLCDAVARRYPHLELRVVTAYSGHLEQWLDTGDLDISLLYNIRDAPRLHTHSLLSEPLWAVGPAKAKLRLDRPISMAELAGHPMVVPVAGHGLRILIDEAFVRARLAPQISVATNALSIQKNLVRNGFGWTVLPASAVTDDVSTARLSAAPLEDAAMSRHVVLALARSGRIAPAVNAVSEQLIELALGCVRSGIWPTVTPAD